MNSMDKALLSSVIPYILLTENNHLLAEGGSLLFNSTDNNYIYEKDKDYYNALKIGGWDISSKGYATYTILFDSYKLIFTGMKVKGISHSKGKNVGIPYYITEKKYAENYFKSFFDVYNSFLKEASQNFQDFTHELKNISTNIGNKAEDIKSIKNLDKDISSRIESIHALSVMIDTKADIMNFISSGKASTIPESRVRPHKKCYKVIKCLEQEAYKKRIKLNICGESQNFICDAPVGFEIIPFLIIENAIKYSPSNNIIDVVVQDIERNVEILFKSFGPQIENHEIDKIFEKGYRGENARKISTSGKGIGLYMVKEFLHKAYNGTISVKQKDPENEIILNQTKYKETTFKLFIPCQNTIK